MQIIFYIIYPKNVLNVWKYSAFMNLLVTISPSYAYIFQ